MAFEYGKNTIKIKNPFKLEGLFDVAQGLIILILGIILVFKIRISLSENMKEIAWVELFAALIFIGFSLRSIIIGCVRMFRFLVGRNMPSDLTPYPYGEEIIEKVLMNRANPTFIEKNNFVSRLIISLFNKFLFLPIGFRNLIEAISSIILSYLILVVVFLIAVFSTSIGLINLTDKEAIINIFGILFLIQQLYIWFKYRPSKARISQMNPNVFGYRNIVITIVLAILTPVILEIASRQGIFLPRLDINIGVPIFLLFIFSSLVTFCAYYLSASRLKTLDPETDVSEYKEHLQLAVHPKDLFRCFEMEMANKRYKEMPNRIYKEIKPVLELEGSENKGSFHGSTVQETQPTIKENELPLMAQKVRLITAIVGRVFFVISALYLFFSIGSLGSNTTLGAIFNLFYYPLLLGVFAHFLTRIAHLFYSEVQFSSYLVHFFADGTYSESQISTGMSVYDSNRSENTVTNTSSTSWILVSEIITSTFADSSTRNLEGNRYILEMYKADEFLEDIVGSFNDYLKNRDLLVGFNSKEDYERSLNFHKLNEITRANNNPGNEAIETAVEREKIQ
jgi:hypothetical protein